MVDLKKFRKVAAGDRLRGQYQGLSQDPNSLSNLDQVYTLIIIFRSNMLYLYEQLNIFVYIEHLT